MACTLALLLALALPFQLLGGSHWLSQLGTAHAPDLSEVETRLADAYDAYHRGERITDPVEAMRHFNGALEIYQRLAVEHQAAPLFYNVANCYFQLGEYPWAILYYERALAIRPRDRRIREQLGRVLACAGLENQMRVRPWWHRALGARLLSMNERLWLAFGLGVLLAITGSVMIWKPHRLLTRLTLSLASAALLLIGSAAALQFFVPPLGILVRAAALRCDGGQHYAPLIPEPLRAGSRVQIEQRCEDPNWVWVRTSEGVVGCLPTENVRIL
jgi:tetratricopeptide (TPR) repeat protein